MASTLPPVLFVALQTGAAANGGIASLGAIMRSLTRFRPIALTNRESVITERWRQAGIEVHIAPETASMGWRRAPLGSAAAYWRYFRVIRSILGQSNVRLVHANDPLSFQLAYAAVKMTPGARIVFNLRDTLDVDRPPPRRKFGWLFSAADHTLFLSRDMIRRWAQIAPAANARSSATYSVVDFERFVPAPVPAEQPKVVLISGVICAKKGQLAFLRDIAPHLAECGIESWLSGDFAPHENEYAASCLAAAESLGDRVRFLGYRDDMPALLKRAHVVCVTSQYEGLMRTMIEAMAAGRPVVSTDVASAREVLEIPGREAGAVFASTADGFMAAEIVRLCENEEANRRMGSNGAAVSRELFRSECVIAAYEDCYASLLGEREAS